MRTRYPGVLAVLACLSWAVEPLVAMPLTVTTPNGGRVRIKVTYSGGATAETDGVDGGALDQDGKADGTFTFTPPNPGQVTDALILNIGAIGVPVGLVTTLDLGTAGLDGFGFFQVPEFGDPDGSNVFVTSIDMSIFTASPTFFTPGDTVPVDTGDPGAPGVVVRDGGVFHIDSFFDIFFEIDIPTLPLLTGDALAERGLANTPEPATWLLLGLGLAAIAWKRRATSTR